MKIKMSIMIMLIIFLIIMTVSFGIQNKQHRETIEIYEEYYVLDEKMDIIYREWVEFFQGYGEEEYYLRYHAKDYFRYLELKEIIGETEE